MELEMNQRKRRIEEQKKLLADVKLSKIVHSVAKSEKQVATTSKQSFPAQSSQPMQALNDAFRESNYTSFSIVDEGTIRQKEINQNNQANIKQMQFLRADGQYANKYGEVSVTQVQSMPGKPNATSVGVDTINQDVISVSDATQTAKAS